MNSTLQHSVLLLRLMTAIHMSVCACVPARMCACMHVWKKGERGLVCYTTSALSTALLLYLPFGGKRNCNLVQTRQVGVNRASMWEQEKQSLAKQGDRLSLLSGRYPTATGIQWPFACSLRRCVFFGFLIVCHGPTGFRIESENLN